jgi:hypothetical protein
LLVLLVGPEGRGKDLLIAGACRRYGSDPAFEVPRRISTRPPGANDAHISVNRRAFSGLEDAGRLFATWTCDGHRFGMVASVGEHLKAGAIVVVAATQSAVPYLRAMWPHVCIIDVRTGPDGFRAPQAQSMSGIDDPPTHVVTHGGDVASAARQLYGLLDMLRSGRTRTLRTQASRSGLAPPGPLAFRRRPPELRGGLSGKPCTTRL